MTKLVAGVLIYILLLLIVISLWNVYWKRRGIKGNEHSPDVVAINFYPVKQPLTDLLQMLSNSYENTQKSAEEYIVVGGNDNGMKLARNCLETMHICVSILNFLSQNGVEFVKHQDIEQRRE